MSSSSLSVVRTLDRDEETVENLAAAPGKRDSSRPQHSVETYCTVRNT